MIDEDRIEQDFWEFDEERKRTGAERDAFKHKLRGCVRYHLRPLLQMLESTEVYLTSYTTGFDPPGGKDRAHHLKREITNALAEYRRAGGRL